MITRYKNFEDMVQSAQRAIDSWCKNEANENTQKEKDWLQKILDILKLKKYATIQSREGAQRDVSKIAHTYDYLSFFDVCNKIRWFDIKINPVETEELKNKIW